MFTNFHKVDDTFFLYCALAGSSLFIIQFILNFFIGLDGSDGDSSGDFKWISKQALTGFVMMFGWVGLTCKKEFELTSIVSVSIALAAGLLAMYITALIFKIASRLHSSGTQFCIDDAIGKEAVVYQQILKDGVGKISISMQGFTHEIDAVSQEGDIPSFTQVRIIKKLDDKTLVVVLTK